MLWSKSWRSSILEITDKETGLTWADFSIWSPRDCGNFGNAEGFDLKPCTCSSFGSLWRPVALSFACEGTDQLQFLSELEYLRLWTIYFLSCCCSVTQWCLFVIPWTAAAHQASLSLTTSQSLPRFVSIALVMLSNHPILWCPLLSLCPGILQTLFCWSLDAKTLSGETALSFTMLEDSFTCFSTLLIATRTLSIKLTLWVRLLTASFIPSSLRYFHCWYSPGALFTSSKKLWKYRISCFKFTLSVFCQVQI